MRRLVIAAALAVASAAHAQPTPAPDPGAPGPGPTPSPSDSPAPSSAGAPAPSPTAPPAAAPAGSDAPPTSDEDVGDQLITATIGLATGGRTTPGGVEVTGHYLYQLSDRDWFDGSAAFAFGSGQGGCFRDRQDHLVCSHGLADGDAVEIVAGVRRLFAPQGQFRPFARLGLGLGLVRFSGDDVSGATVRLHGGGGMRVMVAPAIAVVADGDLALGFGGFSRGLGTEPQLGLAITVGAEFRLR